MTCRLRQAAVLIGLLLIMSLLVAGQVRGRRSRKPMEIPPNVAGDPSRLTFVRIKFTMKDLRFNQVWEPPWAHDLPRAEQHLMKIIQEFTGIRSNPEGIILTLDDPQLFQYPFAYICEVGFLDPTPAERQGLREYLRRGGFMIVDDFGDNFWWRDDWPNFENIMREVVPEMTLREIDSEHPLFHAFFDMQNIDFPNYRGRGRYYILEDEKKRVAMVVNFNNDIGDYWEWSDTGLLGIDLTNEAFKLGVNYLVYGMAH